MYYLDINECEKASNGLLLNNCHSKATCINLPGQYKCECKPGFKGDGYNCVDIDECALMHLHGASNHINLSEVTELQLKTNSNEISIANSCHPQAECHNTIGSFECKCLNGWTGDGITACKNPIGFIF